MFRRATFNDGLAILKRHREFFNKHCHGYGIPFDDDSAMVTIDHILHGGIILVGPASHAGAVIHECLWNYEARIATVMLWAFTRAREIKILEALMAECKAAGATHIVASSHPPANTIGRYYQRLGLQPCENQFIGKL